VISSLTRPLVFPMLYGRSSEWSDLTINSESK
jgi:hypothetical protein